MVSVKPSTNCKKEKKEFENQFQFVAVSMDPKETPPLAKAQKR